MLKTVLIPTKDGEADALAAFPDGEGPHPGVLMYPDAIGVRPEMEAKARELAGHGYYVLVPNFYYRQGPAPVVELPEYVSDEARPALFAELWPLIQAHTTERALSDAEDFLAFLADQPETDGGPVGVLGYCMGAALAMRTATAHPGKVAALAGYHPGHLVTEEADSPHLKVPGLAAEVHLGLAEGDLTPEAVAMLEKAMDTAGVGHSIELYPGTVHGFTMSDTSAFSSEGLRRHWDSLVPLLARALKKG